MGWEWGPNRKEQPCLRGGFEVWLDLGLTSCGRERKNEELLMTLEVYHLGISEMVAAFTKLRLYKEDRVGERDFKSPLSAALAVRNEDDSRDQVKNTKYGERHLANAGNMTQRSRRPEKQPVLRPLVAGADESHVFVGSVKP